MRPRPLANSGAPWFIAAFLTAALIVFFFFASAFQVTDGDTAHRTLRRAVAITTSIDAALPQIQAGLHAAAQSSSEDQVRIPNFPVPVDIPRDEAQGISAEELRNRILDTAADRIYEEGTSVWAANDEAASREVATFSTAGALNRWFAFTTETWHRIFLGGALVFGLMTLVLAAALWLSLTSYVRLIALAACVAIAGVVSLAGAVAVRFALRAVETDADAFEKALLDLAVDTVWLFIRNYLIVSFLGFAVLGVSSLFLWWEGRSQARRPATPAGGAMRERP